jgi:hypothetical protein
MCFISFAGTGVINSGIGHGLSSYQISVIQDVMGYQNSLAPQGQLEVSSKNCAQSRHHVALFESMPFALPFYEPIVHKRELKELP